MSSLENVNLNRIAKLEYLDPEPILREQRRLQVALATSNTPARIANLRVNELKHHREAWCAAIFAYGLGQTKVGTTVYVAFEEAEDYDFIIRWKADDAIHYCPVQLKELVPEQLNPNANVQSLIKGLSKYANSSRTAVVIKINRQGPLSDDLTEIDVSGLDFAGLWFFGGLKPDQSEWFLYGNCLTSPEFLKFYHPCARK